LTSASAATSAATTTAAWRPLLRWCNLNAWHTLQAAAARQSGHEQCHQLLGGGGVQQGRADMNKPLSLAVCIHNTWHRQLCPAVVSPAQNSAAPFHKQLGQPGVAPTLRFILPSVRASMAGALLSPSPAKRSLVCVTSCSLFQPSCFSLPAGRF
jgi:hypothetical protein